MSIVITLPKSIVRELERRARKVGASLEEFLADIATQDLDPSEKAKRYIEGALELLEQAKEELRKNDLVQASEKIWGACALAIKAYAYAKEGKRLASHGELWEYSRIVAKDLGDWVLDAWAHASSMHINFYEKWATREHVERAFKSIEKLVKVIVDIITKK